MFHSFFVEALAFPVLGIVLFVPCVYAGLAGLRKSMHFTAGSDGGSRWISMLEDVLAVALVVSPLGLDFNFMLFSHWL